MKQKLNDFSSLDFHKKAALKRLRFSLLVVLVYVLGTNIIIPGLNTRFFVSMMNSSAAWSMVSSMTGLSLENISLFSLGYGPWMSTMIMWRVLGVLKIVNTKNLTSEQDYRLKILFALGVGGVQAAAILQQVSSTGIGLQAPLWLVGCFMLTGLLVLIWLGNMNAQFGVGGTVLIVLIGILKDFPERFISAFSGFGLGSNRFFLGLVLGLGIFIMIFFVLRFFQGELRLPLLHVMLDQKYTAQAYLPIPVNPAGAMPFMYTFSIVVFPQYIFMLLGGTQSKYEWVRWVYPRLGTDHLLGVGLLVVTLILLTYGFAYVNVDHKTLAEGLQKNGDYFAHIYPGKNTEKYLFDKITRMATVSTGVNIVMIGAPMLVAVLWARVSELALFIPTFIILAMLMREVTTQFHSAYHRDDYPPFIIGSAVENQKIKTKGVL